MLRKRLRVKVLGIGEDIEGDVGLTAHPEFGWRAAVTAEWRGGTVTHETVWLLQERDALAAAATWLRSHFKAKTACIVSLSGSRHAA